MITFSYKNCEGWCFLRSMSLGGHQLLLFLFSKESGVAHKMAAFVEIIQELDDNIIWLNLLNRILDALV